MKKIKIILAIISLFIGVFILTGLFVKETNYTTQVSVNKSIDSVFATFTNISNRKNWIPELNSYEIIKENLGKTGSMYKLTINNKGQEI